MWNVNHVRAALSLSPKRRSAWKQISFNQPALTTRYAAGVREARCESAAALATV